MCIRKCLQEVLSLWLFCKHWMSQATLIYEVMNENIFLHFLTSGLVLMSVRVKI